MNEVALILGMFVATFSVRYVLFAAAGKVHFPIWLSTALGFVPAAVLTAIVVPAVLLPKGELWLSLSNPWLLASFVAIAVSMIKKDLLLTISIGMVAFLILRFAVGL